MSFSACMKCQEMVSAYEKHCDDCEKKYNLKNDSQYWEQNCHPPNEQTREEIIKKDSMIYVVGD